MEFQAITANGYSFAYTCFQFFSFLPLQFIVPITKFPHCLLPSSFINSPKQRCTSSLFSFLLK